jgi:hypothetical protein
VVTVAGVEALREGPAVTVFDREREADEPEIALG